MVSTYCHSASCRSPGVSRAPASTPAGWLATFAPLNAGKMLWISRMWLWKLSIMPLAWAARGGQKTTSAPSRAEDVKQSETRPITRSV